MKYDTGLDFKKIASDIESYLAKQHIIGKVADIAPGPMVSTFFFESESEFNLPKTFNIGSLILYVSGIIYVDGVRYTLIEVHNINRKITWLKPLMKTSEFKKGYITPIVIGINTYGTPIYYDLGFNNSILVTGDRGRGKSTFLSSVYKTLCSFALPEPAKSDVKTLIDKIDNNSNDVFFIDGIASYMNEDSSKFIDAIKRAIKRKVVFIVAANDDNLPDGLINLFPNRLMFKTKSDKSTDFLLPFADAIFLEYGRTPQRVHTPYDDE
jgi:hypothetical protein